VRLSSSRKCLISAVGKTVFSMLLGQDEPHKPPRLQAGKEQPLAPRRLQEFLQVSRMSSILISFLSPYSDTNFVSEREKDTKGEEDTCVELHSWQSIFMLQFKNSCYWTVKCPLFQSRDERIETWRGWRVLQKEATCNPHPKHKPTCFCTPRL
jgi:hypothetical protein